MSSPSRTPKAVLFDIGGVVVRSPMLAISAYEEQHSIPAGYINHAISASGASGAWARLERGEIPLDGTFFSEFTADICAPSSWRSFCGQQGQQGQQRRRRGLDVAAFEDDPPRVDGETLFWRMMVEARVLDPVVVRAIRGLRESGRFAVGALTNDLQYPPGHPYADNSALRALFDVFVSSSESRMRKPERRFYLAAMEKLGVKDPRDVVFLDDIGANLKAAKELGFRTIRVEIGKSSKAIQELESLTGLELLERPCGSKL